MTGALAPGIVLMAVALAAFLVAYLVPLAGRARTVVDVVAAVLLVVGAVVLILAVVG